MRDYPFSPSRTEGSESDGDTCEVYWETKSILLSDPAGPPPPLPRVALPTTHTPAKPKRSTTAAALPSPSTSTGPSTRAARLRKKRRPEGGPVEASQRMDESTLKMVSQLAMRFNTRSMGIAALNGSGGALRDATESGNVPVGRRKDKEAVKGTGGREAPLPSPATLPRPAAPPTLNLASSKPSLSAALSSSKSPLAQPHPPPIRPAPRYKSLPESDDFDAYFNEVDERSFELALSQLDGTTGISTSKPLPAPMLPIPAPPKPLNRLLQSTSNPPTRSSPRLVAQPQSVTTTARAPPPPQPALLKPTRSSTFNTITRSTVSATNASNATRTIALRNATAGAGRSPANVVRTGGAGGIKASAAVVIRGGAAVGAKQKKEMEELARKEMEELLEGAGDWSDGEDF